MTYLRIASSRSGATEVLLRSDGQMLEVEHLKSGRDIVTEIDTIPEYLKVRYLPGVPADAPHQYIQR